MAITLAAIIFFRLSWFLWRRGRKTAGEKADMKGTRPVERDNTTELQGDFMPIELLAIERRPELDGIAVSELHGSVPLE